ncbi:hypothetical protein ROZALSC1DRAFT_25544 [Rozella allomycis CSF55]|uniref:Protein kinase domain-containing protein n=1 Tax=Rozella allomycis (strain CSF55) TaxID=988480 RepID=A0A4P9YAC9_ROZAC|nr:hypothetical protein ROZALSC1DRAFT_25544 [Rozella allomycis CSF55]
MYLNITRDTLLIDSMKIIYFIDGCFLNPVDDLFCIYEPRVNLNSHCRAKFLRLWQSRGVLDFTQSHHNPIVHYVSPAMDVFLFGICFLEIISSQMGKDSSLNSLTYNAMINAHKSCCAAASDADCQKALRVVGGCLDKDPASRKTINVLLDWLDAESTFSSMESIAAHNK